MELVVVIIPSWLYNRLSVAHQRLSCLMMKINFKLFKVCCSFIKALLMIFVPIFGLFQIFPCKRNFCVDTLKLLIISISLSVDSVDNPLWCYSRGFLFLVIYSLQTFIGSNNNSFCCVKISTRNIFLMQKCVTYLKN